jgi:uncharacterized membrane protein
MNINATPQRKYWTDERVDLLIGNLLRYGVMIAATVAIVGGIPYLFAHGADVPNYRTFAGQPESLATVGGIVSRALQFDSAAIIQLGIVLLVATPVARVVLSLFAFAMQRDRTYVVITTVVLAILAWSLTGGIA